jgi:hypothetical protein
MTGEPSNASLHDALLGHWQLLRSEAPLEFEPGTQMRFAADGTLEYHIPTAGGALQVALQWRLEAGALHTALADGTNPVQAQVSIGAGDVLAVDFGGPRAWFVRST